MNKKLLSLAVAATLAAPAIASAEAIMYGKMNVSLDYADVTNVILPTPQFDNNGDFIGYANGEDFKGWGLSKGVGYIPGEGRASRLGVKGSEDLGNGLKAIYQIEFGINFDTNNNLVSNADTVSYRNTFVGLAGDWGTLLMGRHDTPFKISTGKLDLFSDTMADYNGTIGFQDLRVDNAVAYISPSWSGFQLAAATVPAGGSTAFGQRNLNSDQINGAYSLAAIYKNGPFYGAVAYESISNEMFMTQADSLAGACPVVQDPQNGTNVLYSCDYIGDDTGKWRVGLGLLDWNGFSLTGIYEHQEDLPASQVVVGAAGPDAFLLPAGPEKRDLWQIQAGYAFGNSMVKAMYGQSSNDGNYFYSGTIPEWIVNEAKDAFEGSADSWAIGYDYNFSKRTTAYALYTQTTSDQENISAGSEWSGFSLGMMHSF